MAFFEKRNWKIIASGVLLLCSVIGLLLALNLSPYPADSQVAAQKVQKVLDARMGQLDSYVQKALEGDNTQWMDLGEVPQDMVIYRYVNDTLQSWANRFTISNDDIGRKVVVQQFTSQRASLSSPLLAVTPVVQFLNLGPTWYLTYLKEQGDTKVIAGLEIMSETLSTQGNGVNRSLGLGSQFSVKPLSFSGGSAVSFQEVPQFKILFDTFKSYTLSKAYMIWVALLLFVAALLLFLSAERTLKRYYIVLAGFLAVLLGMYLFGFRLQEEAEMFSPTLYADGPLLYSLAAVVIINLALTLLVGTTYMIRGELYRRLQEKKTAGPLAALSICACALAVGILVYSFFALRSIILNSSINLELYKLEGLSWYTLVVYASFLGLLMMVPLLLQLLRPALKKWLNIHLETMSRTNLAIYALLISVFMVSVAAVFGFRKEQDRVSLWANRLSIDRDITLELELRSVENEIAADVLIASLSVLDNTNSVVLNRIMDYYMSRLSQDYDVSVFILNQDNSTPQAVEYVYSRIQDGKPIFDNSRFVYNTTSQGHSRYAALFTFYSGSYGPSNMLLEVEPKANKEDRGFSSLLGYTSPGRVTIPARYSYAKYDSGKLTSYRGAYPYVRTLSDDLLREMSSAQRTYLERDSYSHFVNNISDDEIIVISRPKTPNTNFLLDFIFVALIAYAALSIMAFSRKRRPLMERTYYRTRVTTTLVASLVLTMVVLALVSVLFVYRRNDANRHMMMVEKISSIQNLLESRCRNVRDFTELTSQEFTSALETVSDMTGSDIMLYTPTGVAFKSTTQEVLDNMLFGSRIDADAFKQISFDGSRYFIDRDMLNGHKYYSLYAPVCNDSGQMLAIASSPYIASNYDFETEAIIHTIALLCVFLILMFIARILIGNIVDRMFKPLSELGSKMGASDVDSLEYLEYDRDDEITTLVQSYNKMVSDLSDSTRKLAQAERDKAWSGMARQVAHEIKNPLTPMKLQLQRLIRLKQKGDPHWQDIFDEVAKVVLDHIDILSETANEFSTFAKLYTEEPTSMDLDLVLREEIAMFDNRENIQINYMGLKDAVATGPKPQLTRVFVNLINNAIQAVEEQGGGTIQISLRNSSSGDGFYDIVFEDSGPGVASENVDKLFTPNFTTKSSGTGLGLAISRSILERCGARISYSRSFVLGGACFTIVYPK